MMRILALLAALVALVALAVLATRHRPEACATWIEPEDGVQPADPWLETLAHAHDRWTEVDEQAADVRLLTLLDRAYGPWVGPWPPATWRSDNLESVRTWTS